MNVQADDDDFPEGLFYFYRTSEYVPVESVPEPPAGEEPVRVPLVIYIGDDRKIIGDAIVKQDGEIEAFIDPVKGRDLAHLVERGILQNVSITFNAPPAIPQLEDGHIRWKKDY